MTTSVIYQRQFFADLAGLPLDSGKLYVGSQNQDAQTHQIQCYWDIALTVPATQPFTISGGCIINSGARGALYVSVNNYSMTILDRFGGLVDAVPDGSAIFNTAIVAVFSGSNGADQIHFTPNGTGATFRSVTDAFNDGVSAFNFIGADQADGGLAYRAAITARTSIIDHTAYLRSAMAVAALTRRKFRIPAGLYNVRPYEGFAAEGGTCLRAFPILSNLEIEADPGATFRVMDGVSTDGAPVQMCMFGGNGVYTNIAWRGLVMDMNGANNLISPSRGTLVYNRYAQAQINVTGTPGGVAAAASNAVVDNCQFINSPGVSCIVLGQSNTVSTVLGSGWRITNNLFKDNGLDTDDHSSIYAWANDVHCLNNRFIQSTPFGTVGKVGGNTAYEIHGSNQYISHNTFVNYQRGIWIDGNYTSVAENIIIDNNIFKTLFFGVSTFNQSVGATAMSRITITNNAFYFDDTVVAAVAGLNEKVCLAIGQSAVNAITHLTATGNRAYKSGSTIAATFMDLGDSNVSGKVHSDIVITGNTGYGLSIGTSTVSTSQGLGNITITGNNWDALTGAGIFATGIGDFVNATVGIASMTLGGGSVTDTRGSPLAQYGHYLSGTVTNYNQLPSVYVGMQTANISDGLTATHRNGLPSAFAILAATATAGAATLHTTNGKVTTENLTTAAGATYTLTVTNNQVTAASRVGVTLGNGGNTTGIPVLATVTPGAGSVVIVVKNDHASAAFNGALVVCFQVFN